MDSNDILGYELPSEKFEDDISVAYDAVTDLETLGIVAARGTCTTLGTDIIRSTRDDLDALLYILEERYGITIDLRRSN